MRAPKQLWFVEVSIAGTLTANGNRYMYGGPSRLGGKFSSLKAAQNRKKDVLHHWPDATVKVYGTGLLTWTEIG